jgi:hypothetical protein
MEIKKLVKKQLIKKSMSAILGDVVSTNVWELRMHCCEPGFTESVKIDGHIVELDNKLSNEIASEGW